MLRKILSIFNIRSQYQLFQALYNRQKTTGKIICTIIFSLLAVACIVGEVLICETIFGGAFSEDRLVVLIIGIPVTAALGYWGFGCLSGYSRAAFRHRSKVRKEAEKEVISAPANTVVDNDNNATGGETTPVENTVAETAPAEPKVEAETKPSNALDVTVGTITLVVSIVLIIALFVVPIAYLKASGK